MKVIFLLGSGHCGSTLLDLILGSHSRIVSVGELSDLRSDSNDLCLCGAPYRQCAFWGPMIANRHFPNQKIYRTKRDFFIDKCRFHDSTTGRIIENRDYCTLLKNVFQDILAQSNAEYIVDSSKSIDRAELLASDPDIEPVIIHLFRDGRATSWSYRKKYGKFFRYAWKWMAINLKIEIVRRRGIGRSIFISYHQLARDPERTLKTLCDFLEVPYESSMLRYRNRAHHTVGGNRMKWNHDESICEDNDWVKKMPGYLKVAFFVFFGWLMFYYKTVDKLTKS